MENPSTMSIADPSLERLQDLYESSHLPQDLHRFKISAPQVVKGGERVNLHIVQYPPLLIEEDGERESILSTWNEWWSRTEWALNPSAGNPHWNSPTRHGQVWSQFGEAADSVNGHPYVFCLNCSLVLQHPTAKGIGTKHLLNHLDTKGCKATLISIHPQLPTLFTRSSQSQSRSPHNSVPSYSTLDFEKELVRVVIDSNWSFQTIEQPSFQRFIRFLRPDAVITSRYKFQKMFWDQFQEAKASLLNDLGRSTKISIALDAWSANNHLSFLAIKGYYINIRWQLQEKLLDFIPMRGRHTGVSMAEEVLQVLSETTTKRRLLAITCDNASNNSMLARAVKLKLQDKDIHWSPEENTVPCLAHIINLVVQDIIQHLQLATSTEGVETLQKRHVQEIEVQMSVPNLLRKVCTLLSHIFITS
jgi:hypothetical protein